MFSFIRQWEIKYDISVSAREKKEKSYLSSYTIAILNKYAGSRYERPRYSDTMVI